LNGRIKPSRHPNLVGVIKRLNKLKKAGEVAFSVKKDEDIVTVGRVDGMEYFKDANLVIVPHTNGIQAVITATDLEEEPLEALAVSIIKFVEKLVSDEGILLSIIAMEE
tara:strand:- start:2398 stop:2724 length:327 start_codon:yes stop_codon:yes gene_type:complete